MGNKKMRTEKKMFVKFWSVWPKKTNKRDAERLFNKLDTATQIRVIQDVIRRVKFHAQWKDKQHIPAPDRYLRAELFEDEIIEEKTAAQDQAEREDGTIHARFWTMLIQMLGKRFEREYGPVMPVAWRHGLSGLTRDQASKILKILSGDPSPRLPDLPKINSLRKYVVGDPPDKMLPRPEGDPDIIAAAFLELRKILHY